MILGQLQAAGSRDVAELLLYLEVRGRELADGATLMLHRRGDAEALTMRSILEQQKERIGTTARTGVPVAGDGVTWVRIPILTGGGRRWNGN